MRTTILIVVTSLLASSAWAGEVDPALRRLAMDTCREDATRLCPMSLSDETTVVACMSGQREALSKDCRAVYDRVVRALGQ